MGKCYLVPHAMRYFGHTAQEDSDVQDAGQHNTAPAIEPEALVVMLKGGFLGC